MASILEVPENREVAPYKAAVKQLSTSELRSVRTQRQKRIKAIPNSKDRSVSQIYD